LPEPAVTPSEHFNTILYTGTGSSASHTIGFRPNLVWGKKRNAAQNNWLINDVGDVNKWLSSDGTGAEGSEANGTTFDTNGFTTASNDLFYNNGGNYVVWSWKGNGTGTAVSNTDGNITSTVSANVDAGFSIVGYTGNSSTNQTVGHGLSKTPDIVIIKSRDDASAYWSVINPRRVSAADPNILYLNDTMAEADSTNIMGDNLPTATTVGVDDYDGTNKNGDDFIMYCWHSVDGFSKMGTYTGNGNADGTFVYTGFRPAYVMIKGANITSHWQIHDTTRSTYNVMGDQLHANENAADASASAYYIDSVSNGFKLRMSHAGQNGSGQFYIYMAFAETPFKYSNAR
jgi:hypothetical protein